MVEAGAPAMSAAAPSLNAARWTGFLTIIIREYSRIVRIWGQTLVPSAVTAILYFVIFGSLIGRRVGQMGGFDYMQYIAPGLIMMSVITNSYGNSVSSFFFHSATRAQEILLENFVTNCNCWRAYRVGRAAGRTNLVRRIGLLTPWVCSARARLADMAQQQTGQAAGTWPFAGQLARPK